ncbi:hypothetical protein OIDMADRAFT_115413, partial [Oidiodendron maius Zn]
LAKYHFIISYRPSKQNQKADILTWRDIKDQIDPRVLQDLGIKILAIDLLSIKEEDPFNKSNNLVNWILQANKDIESLEALYIQAKSTTLGKYTIKDRLLLYIGQLVVSTTLDNLYIELIQEAYNQISTAYPGRDKTY